MPEIVKVARFVAGTISQREDFFRRRFSERVRLDHSAIWKIRELLVGAEYRARFKGKFKVLADRDIHLDAAARGRRSNVTQVERVTVRVRMTILTIEREFNCAAVTNRSVDRVQLLEDVFERHLLQKREVEVLGKSVVAEIAALEGGPALEGKAGPQVAASQLGEEPRQAIIAFENALGNSTTARFRETVGKQREVALRYQIRSSEQLRVLRATRSAADARRKRAGLRLAASGRAPRKSR